MGGKDLVVRSSSVAAPAPALDLREVAARATLNDVRQKGHIYVELRRAGKRNIFFCTLCLTPCYSDGVLFDHLKGNLHARRYAAAKATLFGPDPWPFSDGVLFFDRGDQSFAGALVARNGDGVDEATSRIRDDGTSSGGSLVVGNGGAGSLVVGNGNTKALKGNRNKKKMSKDNGNLGEAMDGQIIVPKRKGSDACRTIHGVLLKERVLDLKVDLVGLGHVAAGIQGSDEGRGKIIRIWCAWLGRGDSGDGDGLLVLPKCDFAVVSFRYANDLGRTWTLNDISSPHSEGSSYAIDEDDDSPGKKMKKSFSDPEDSSDSLTMLSGASGNASQHLQISRFLSSKPLRRELRKRKRLAVEKTCDICAQQMILGKDVGTLLNCKTGNLACSSRNTNGAFHLFHVSCLVHWILLCEFEMRTDQSGNLKPTRGRKPKATLNKRITSVFCPECQGTGKHIIGDELEQPTIPLSEVFIYKLKAIEAQKAWMKNPEVLQKCSTGLHFPSDADENYQEKVMPLKLLHFYRACIGFDKNMPECCEAAVKGH